MSTVTDRRTAWPPPSAGYAPASSQTRDRSMLATGAHTATTRSIVLGELRQTAPKRPPVEARAAVQASGPATVPARAPNTSSAVLVMLPMRLFLAAGWVRAGIEKLIDSRWWSGTGLRSFLDEHHQNALPFFRPVMDRMIAPSAVPVSIAVVLLEIGCGIAIGVGRPMRGALRIGVLLNVVFIVCGQVNPSAFYLVMEIALLFAISEGIIGVHQKSPSGWTFTHAVLALSVAAALTPSIRTMEPAQVIADPAMMLVFLSCVVCGTLILRWALANVGNRISRLPRYWTDRVMHWADATPCVTARAASESSVMAPGSQQSG